jgi:glycosyltransferase involved in cell wall biosynthesis
VFPSRHEGFGLPVLEAQSCGCPVITSATSSLPEVAGDGALLIDPEDTAAITAAMHRITTEPALRHTLVERGFVNVRRFSWRRCAQTALNALERCASVVR